MGADDTYRTVDDEGLAELSVRGSRFIGGIRGVTSVEDADGWIEEWRTAYPDATHVVPAYRIRGDPVREWASDDGEPSGSAGKPLLSLLQGEELEDVVAVVVRYYGGTNLGIGGLVRAYGDTLRQAIADATIDTCEPTVVGIIETSYDDSGTVRSILESAEVMTDATYEITVSFDIEVPHHSVEAIEDRVFNATSGRVDIRWEDSVDVRY